MRYYLWIGDPRLPDLHLRVRGEFHSPTVQSVAKFRIDETGNRVVLLNSLSVRKWHELQRLPRPKLEAGLLAKARGTQPSPY